jgi:hypothetical protein
VTSRISQTTTNSAPKRRVPALPHERDQASGSVATQPDPLIVQAKRDIDNGLVDTDMRATPGLDAERRARLVPTPMPAAPPPGLPKGRRPRAEPPQPGASAVATGKAARATQGKVATTRVPRPAAESSVKVPPRDSTR